MLDYLTGIMCGILGWLGSRRLSLPLIITFIIFLFIELIVIFHSIVTQTGKNSGLLIFLQIIAMLLISIWSITLWRFAWIIYREKEKSIFTVHYASDQCRSTTVCV